MSLNDAINCKSLIGVPEPLLLSPVLASASLTQQQSRKGDYIMLRDGKRFYPQDPRVGDFTIEVIAFALSNLCRYGGHVSFYSVAEHAVLCSEQAPPEFEFEALMHDASEAYLVDMPRPLKAAMPIYREIEAGLEKVIAEQFDMRWPMSKVVKEIDNRMLASEGAWFFNGVAAPNDRWWENDKKYAAERYPDLTFGNWLPHIAYEKFLDRYQAVKGHR